MWKRERERERQYDRHLRTRDMSRDFVRGEEIVEERERDNMIDI